MQKISLLRNIEHASFLTFDVLVVELPLSLDSKYSPHFLTNVCGLHNFIGFTEISGKHVWWALSRKKVRCPAMSDKLAKEAFVSGLSGTSLGEISILTLTLSAGYLLRCVLAVALNLKTSSTLTSFLFEYTTIVLPGILVFTVLADYALYIFVGLVISSLLVVSFRHGSSVLKYLTDTYSRALSSPYPYPRRLPFVTLFRTYITLFTAIAILAVDFTIFPRRLAKAETYGSGLMDVGVGTFMMAHGVTAPESRCQSNKRLSPRSYVKLLLATLRGVLPLLVIGILRLMIVKNTNYQEHVTEYGVHWNFFFTIAFVRVST